jgi:uncharacterized protein
MALIEKHKPGSFCWFELATTDQSDAKRFYQGLFGWEVFDEPIGPSEVYTMFRLEGTEAAAAYTMRPEQRAHGVPPNWALYISVESADQVVARAAELGGHVHMPAFDLAEHGRMSVIGDPAGAVFAVWEAKKHKGVGVTGIDGTAVWADLVTSDPEAAGKFYGGLFGWTLEPGKDDSGYLHIKNGEDYIGGIPPAKYRDPSVPPHWMLYFLTSDCEASAAKAKELGGAFLMPPQKVSNVGTMAILKDPQGAVFALFQNKD